MRLESITPGQARDLRGRARSGPPGLGRRRARDPAHRGRSRDGSQLQGQDRGGAEVIRLVARLLLLALALLGGVAGAHEMSMAEMQVRELGPGEYQWRWSASERKEPERVLAPVWPAGCVAEADLLHCGPAGLRGTMSIRGVGDAYSAVLMKIYWRDGDARAYTIAAGQPTVQLYGASEDRRDLREVASAYFVLGIEHILSGFDHLLFVIGLLFPGRLQSTPGVDDHGLHGRSQPHAGERRAGLADASAGAGRGVHRAVDRARRLRSAARPRHLRAPSAGAGRLPLRPGPRTGLRGRAQGDRAARQPPADGPC